MKTLNNLIRRFNNSPNSKVIAVLTSLHITFIVLFDKVTAFAPDEKLYISIFKNLYNSNFSLNGSYGWPEGSINPLRVIYLPAKILEIIGFSDFYSIRMLTVFYSMLTLYLLLRLTSNFHVLGKSSRFWIVAAFFVPSYFLWTSIGLREGFIFLALIGLFYGMKLSHNTQRICSSVLILASAICLLISKTYLYSLFIVALLAAVITVSLLTKKLDLSSSKILALCLIPALFFPAISTNIIISARSWAEIKFATPTQSSSPTPEILTRGQTLHDLNTQLNNNSILAWISNAIGISTVLEDRSQNAYLPAGSEELSENSKQLQIQPASLRDPLSVLKGAFNFLFVPAPFVDNGSFFLNAQSYESFAWYIYYVLLVLLIFGVLRRKYELNLHSILATYFSLGFIILSVLVEVNYGTSVRHRSVLLFGILIMLAIFQEIDSKTKPSKFIIPSKKP